MVDLSSEFDFGQINSDLFSSHFEIRGNYLHLKNIIVLYVTSDNFQRCQDLGSVLVLYSFIQELEKFKIVSLSLCQLS